MAYRWPDETVFSRLELHVEEQWCQTCGGRLRVCDHRHRRVFTLHGPLQVVCKLVHCPERVCPAHPRTLSPEAETALAMPWWVLGWDVVCWLGQRRFARHWAVGQIRTELADTYQIRLSDDAIERYSHRYQQMLAARQHDPHQLAAAYADVEAVILSIDGLQPEKGHETLSVVRELERKPVRLWMSDKQDAFVRGIAAEFPGVPHRYCANHFLRDVAKPVLEADSHAKVRMRRTVRGLRAIEQEVLSEQRTPEPPSLLAPPREATSSDAVEVDDESQDVVLDYCAAVRGILNDDQGGPLHPPGLRMAEALADVHASLQRNVEAQKGGRLTSAVPV